MNATDIDSLERYLVMWGAYMRRDDTDLGLPKQVPWLMSRARIQSFEDLADSVDSWAVLCVDAAIRDCPAHSVILHAVYAAPQGVDVLGEDVDMVLVDALLVEAQDALRPGLRKRGLAV
jgi:hypothetical protein